jgi:hypothetical protein
MYTLGKPHLFYYNVDKQEFNIDTQRNGESIRRKWSPLNDSIGISDRIYLKYISFGICTHPFNPEGVSFKRKPFSKLKEDEYGIAFKGIPIKLEDWENLAPDSNPIDMSTRKMMNRRGAEVSYPYIVKRLKAEGLYELAKKSIEDSGINTLTTSRTLPKIDDIYFVPTPVYAIEITPRSVHLRILFNEKQSVRSWSKHHEMHDLKCWNIHR